MINECTQLLGVIGDPISHSLSPALQNFVIRKMALNYHYYPFQVTEKELEKAIVGFRTLKFKGINITLPHKHRVMQYIDEISDEAKALGAVNTLLFKNNKIIGYNTDTTGFLNSLGDFRPRIPGGTALVLGAGGATRAVIYALIQEGIKQIKLFNRTLSHGRELADQLRKVTGFQKLSVQSLFAGKLSREIRKACLLINTTSVGMHPNITDCPIEADISFPDDILVYDLIYNPWETNLLKKARNAGAKTMNGLDMLIFQGLASLQIWTGKKIDSAHILPELRILLTSRMKKNGSH